MAALAELMRIKRRASAVVVNTFRQAIQEKSEEDERLRQQREAERHEAFEKAKAKRLEELRVQKLEEDRLAAEKEKKKMHDIVQESRLHAAKSRAEKKQLLEAEKQAFLERKIGEEMRRIHDLKKKAAEEKRARAYAEQLAKAQEEAQAMGVHLPGARTKAADTVAVQSKDIAPKDGAQLKDTSVPAAGSVGMVDSKDESRQNDGALDVKREVEVEEPPLSKPDYDSNAAVTESKTDEATGIPTDPSPGLPLVSDPGSPAKGTANAKADLKPSSTRPAAMEKTESQKSLEYRKTQERIKQFENGTLPPSSKKTEPVVEKAPPPKKKRGCLIS